MSEQRLQIAGFRVALIGADAREMARYRLFRTRARPDLKLYVTRRAVEALPRRLVEPRIFYERGLHRYAFERPGLYGDADLRRGVGRLVIDTNPATLDTALRVALTAALLTRGTFLVHAAGVRQGLLFPGPSGAGKTTLARRAGADTLSDEIIGVSPGRIHSTPFWGEGARARRNGSAALRLTCFLRRHGVTGVRLISRARALAELLSAIIFFADAEPAAHRLTRLARAVISGRPALTLRFDRRRHTWRHILRWIEDTAS